MSIHADDDGTAIALTDFHITRAIADALTNSYQGEMDIAFTEKNGVMRASWTR